MASSKLRYSPSDQGAMVTNHLCRPPVSPCSIPVHLPGLRAGSTRIKVSVRTFSRIGS